MRKQLGEPNQSKLKMSQRKLHEEIQDLKDQLKNRDEEVKVVKTILNQSTTLDWKVDLLGQVEHVFVQKYICRISCIK